MRGLANDTPLVHPFADAWLTTAKQAMYPRVGLCRNFRLRAPLLTMPLGTDTIVIRNAMGIFDKKSSKRNTEDFDSPIEQVDLSAPSPTPAPEEPAPAPEVPPEPAPQEYGIEQAIALMRTLPNDSVELVVRVVKHTLESTDIHIPSIIEDASKKQKRIDDRVALLKEEIRDLESEIAQRTEEIGNLEEDHKETSMVKERLELAEKLDKQAPKGAAKLNPLAKKPGSK